MQPLPVLYAQNIPAVQALINHYRGEVHGLIDDGRGNLVLRDATESLAADTDWTNVVTRFVASAIDLFSNFGGDPAQRKAAVTQAAVQFYLDVIKPILAAGVGRPFLFNAIVEPVVERLLPKVIGGLYDAVAGIFGRKAAAAPAAQPGPAVAPGLPAGFVPY